MSTTITFGPHSIDLTTLPPTSLHILAQRGARVIASTEMAAKASPSSSWAKKQAADGVEVTDALRQAEVARNVDIAHKALLDGTMGVRVPGTPKAKSGIVRATPTEREFARLVDALLLSRLRGMGIKNAKGKDLVKLPDDETSVTAANGKVATVGDIRVRLLGLGHKDDKGNPTGKTNAEAMQVEAEKIIARDRKIAEREAAKGATELDELLG